MKVIYFNQWFSSIANVIDDLKAKYQVRIIASSRTPEHAYRYSVDEFFIEDWEETENKHESMQNYVEWVLNLCRINNVNLFFVKKHATDIMKQSERFKEIGVTLISEDYKTLKAIESKSGVYKKLVDCKCATQFIPEYHVFARQEEALTYIELHRGLNDICVKFDRDEGGASFRAIKDKEPSLKDMYSYDVNNITSDEVCKIIKTAGKNINKLLFMEILDSPEISIDCYNSKDGFISLARMKVAGRKQKLFYDEQLADVCKSIGDVLGLKFPYNVQFRIVKGKNYDNIGNLRLLEINPRMSGGLYYEVLCGMNIAEICMLDNMEFENKGTQCDYSKFINFKDCYVTHVEKAIKVDI